MLGKEEKQTEKGTNGGRGRGKKERAEKNKRGIDLKQLKERKAMIYHWEGEVE